MTPKVGNEFERAAQEPIGDSVIAEIWLFLRHNKKWWLIPILFILGLFSLLALLAGSGAAPFIYTLF
jgi:hypothetical protein